MIITGMMMTRTVRLCMMPTPSRCPAVSESSHVTVVAGRGLPPPGRGGSRRSQVVDHRESGGARRRAADSERKLSESGAAARVTIWHRDGPGRPAGGHGHRANSVPPTSVMVNLKVGLGVAAADGMPTCRRGRTAHPQSEGPGRFTVT